MRACFKFESVSRAFGVHAKKSCTVAQRVHSDHVGVTIGKVYPAQCPNVTWLTFLMQITQSL